ncbi:MAG: enoyl-CoA hydratase-related protein, partial [Planctomycetes bacterium]|nr:enoyl-CoA hydratase-related protein [Planctomycetota bacterium]
MSEDEQIEELAEFGYEYLHIDLDDEGLALITINRPKALNALNAQVLDELRDAVVELAQVPEVEVLMITGSGEKAFVAGADIGAMVDFSPLDAREFSHMGQDTFATIESCPKPVIALINGFALGGGLELAMSCHLRLASDNAKMGLPEVTLGLIPGFGGTQRLARLCGPGVAREWILPGDAYSAEDALRAGLVSRIVPQAELL